MKKSKPWCSDPAKLLRALANTRCDGAPLQSLWQWRNGHGLTKAQFDAAIRDGQRRGLFKIVHRPTLVTPAHAVYKIVEKRQAKGRGR